MKNKKTIAIWAVVILVSLFIGREIMTSQTVRKWFKPHPNDLVETSIPGVFVRQGVSASATQARSGVVTDFPVGKWVTIKEGWAPGTSILIDFETDVENVEFVMSFGRNEVTNYASCNPETVTGKNSSARAKLEVVGAVAKIKMLPGQSYGKFIAKWRYEE